jgi:uncharacterized protein YqgC (DUF456 family)
MEIILIILGGVLLLVGFVGCIIPALPGPPISFAGLLLLLFMEGMDKILGSNMLLWTAVAVVLVTVIDYVLPIWGTKKFGGTKAGVRGSTLGLILAIFLSPVFGPIGFIVAPFVGALIAEIIAGQSKQVALKSAVGSFIGFISGTLLKLVVSGWITVAFIQALITYYG